MSYEQRQNQGQQGLVPALFNFPRLSGRFPALWEDFFGDLRDLGADHSGLSISEDKKNIYVEAALPGLKNEDVDVTLDKGVLWIKGEKKEEQQDKDKKYYRKATSSFSYRLALPNNIDETKEPKANLQNGVMTITFAKAPQSQAKKINIK